MRSLLVGLALLLPLIGPPALLADPGPQRDPVPPVPPGIGPPDTSVAGTWKRLGVPPARPGPRMATYAVVDPARDRMVLFGGWGFGTFDDTWALDLGTGRDWTPLAVGAPHPGPRFEFASIHDPVRDRMLVFGGKNPYTNETWALSLSGTPSWELLATAGTPPGPRETRAVHDPVRDRMILFGGFSYPDHLNDTWALDLSGTPTWHQLQTTGTAPAPRRGQTVVHDPLGDRLIVFGGFDEVTFMNDVWVLDLGTLAWQRLLPAGTPPTPRYGHSATYDPDRHEMVVFGGFGPVFAFDRRFLNDTHVLSLGTSPSWSRIATSSAPAVRDFHSAVHDGPRHRVVLFGGNSGPVYSDVWAFDTGARTWTRLDGPPPAASIPQPRLGTYAVHDPDDRRMVLFGGWGFQYFDDTWTLALDSDPPLWTPIPGSPRPSARLEHATAYDGTRDRMLLFGGKDPFAFFNDLWQLDLTGVPVWSPVATAGEPPSPRECRAAYDPVRDRLLIFGGFSHPNHLNETWELSLSGTPTWSRVLPRGPDPEPRRGQSLIYDPVRDRLVLFGGYDDRRFYGDVWELRLSGQPTWVPVATPPGGPSPRYGHSATYDPVRRAMVVIGGYDGSFLDDAWVLPLDGVSMWSRLEADPHPGPTDFHTVIHDPDRDRFLLFGGNDGRPLGDLWELSLAGAAASAAPAAGSPISHPAVSLALSGSVRVPASGSPVVHLTLPTAAPARLELFDVAGRRLAERSFTPSAPGRQTLQLGEARGLRAGVYLVRLSQGGESVVGRAVFVP